MSHSLRTWWWLPLALVLASACAEAGPGPAPPSPTPPPTATPAPATPTPSPAPVTPTPSPSPAPEPRLEVLVANADFPVALAFAPDGRLFYNELRTGRIRIVEEGRLQEAPFAELAVQATGEHGLLGLAIDPNFQENRYVYAFYTVPAPDGSPLKQQVVRFKEVAGRALETAVILDDLPVGPTCCHNGGRLAFGPDGKLYVSIGDTQDPDSAQDRGKLSGKVLRYNPDGTIPDDNPFSGSPVFALGLRNVFGLAFRPQTGQLFATDNGPVGHDELNAIWAGENYGWPLVMGIDPQGRFIDPIFETGEDTLVPTGMTFYRGGLLPFEGDLFFCSFGKGMLLRVAAADLDRLLTSPEADMVAVAETGQPCQLDVKVGPDGGLYFSDTNSIYRWGR